MAAQSSSLSHHRVVHTDQGLRPYVCRHNRCGATYTQLARLITHQRTTHSGMILFIPQDASSSTPSGPCSELVSDDIHATAPTTEPRALHAPVDSSLQPPDRSNDASISKNRPRLSRNPATEPSREPPTDEIDDMEQRREAAMTMASLRELAVQERGGYSASNTGSHPSTRPPPPTAPQLQTQSQSYQQSQQQSYPQPSYHHHHHPPQYHTRDYYHSHSQQQYFSADGPKYPDSHQTNHPYQPHRPPTPDRLRSDVGYQP